MSGHLAAIPYLDRPTDSNKDQVAEIGAIRIHQHTTLGMQQYRLVQNNRGSAIPTGQLCAFDTGSASKVTLATAATLMADCAGVAVAEIPDAYWGWVLCRGQVSADASGTTTAGEFCRPAAGGQVNSDATPSSSVEAAQLIGVWVEGSAGAGLKTANLSIT